MPAWLCPLCFQLSSQEPHKEGNMAKSISFPAAIHTHHTYTHAPPASHTTHIHTPHTHTHHTTTTPPYIPHIPHTYTHTSHAPPHTTHIHTYLLPHTPHTYTHTPHYNHTPHIYPTSPTHHPTHTYTHTPHVPPTPHTTCTPHTTYTAHTHHTYPTHTSHIAHIHTTQHIYIYPTHRWTSPPHTHTLSSFWPNFSNSECFPVYYLDPCITQCAVRAVLHYFTDEKNEAQKLGNLLKFPKIKENSSLKLKALDSKPSTLSTIKRKSNFYQSKGFYSVPKICRTE